MKKFETNDELFPSNWELIYVDKENPTPLEIIKEVIKMKGDYTGDVFPFRSYDFEGADDIIKFRPTCSRPGITIKNDNDLFYELGRTSIPYVWQVGPKATDMFGTIIPNTYLVRTIGFWIG